MSSLYNLYVEFKKKTDDLFSSNGFECRRLFHKYDSFYCATDVLLCLGDTENIEMLDEVRNEDKFTVNKIKELILSDSQNDNRIDYITKDFLDSLKKYNKDCVFLNKVALQVIVIKSKNKKSEPFRDFVLYTFLPTLDKFQSDLFLEQCKENDKLIAEKEALIAKKERILKKKKFEERRELFIEKRIKFAERRKLLAENDLLLFKKEKRNRYLHMYVKRILYLQKNNIK